MKDTTPSERSQPWRNIKGLRAEGSISPNSKGALYSTKCRPVTHVGTLYMFTASFGNWNGEIPRMWSVDADRDLLHLPDFSFWSERLHVHEIPISSFATMSTLQQIETQAEKLAATAKALAIQCREAGLSESSPPWGITGIETPHEVDRSRNNMLANISRLQAMLAGPREFIQQLAHQVLLPHGNHLSPHGAICISTESLCSSTNDAYCTDPGFGMPPMAGRVPNLGLHPPRRRNGNPRLGGSSQCPRGPTPAGYSTDGNRRIPPGTAAGIRTGRPHRTLRSLRHTSPEHGRRHVP